jgi:4-azaleucine resistance transporter AzlC
MTGEPASFTRAGILRGMRRSLPLIVGLTPFGLVTGILAQAKGLSLAETTLMSALVYAGASQILALGAWTVPAPIVAATLSAFIVNLRMALMGPVLTPWLERFRGWRVWGTLFFLVDHGWALSVSEMRAGRNDLGFLFGCGVLLWVFWVITSILGHLLGSWLQPPPGHPIFFAALAAFVSLLVPMWRSTRDLLPWAVAIATACLVAWLLPGTSWHIVAGALAGSLAGAARDSTARSVDLR